MMTENSLEKNLPYLLHYGTREGGEEINPANHPLRKEADSLSRRYPAMQVTAAKWKGGSQSPTWVGCKMSPFLPSSFCSQDIGAAMKLNNIQIRGGQ